MCHSYPHGCTLLAFFLHRRECGWCQIEAADARITQHGKLCYVLCATRTHTAALCLLFSCTGASVGGARMKRLTRELRNMANSIMSYVPLIPHTHTAALCLFYSCTGASVGGARMKRLTRELRDLTGKFALPCNPAASIFLRHDGDHLDKMRAIITGGGCVYTG